MMDWLRRVDPGFYQKEPQMLRTKAQLPRYTEDAQAEARIAVLAGDRTAQLTVALLAFSAYVVATGSGALVAVADPATIWALAVLTAAAPCALPWWPHPDRLWPLVRQGVLGFALIAIPAALWRAEPLVFALAAAAAAILVAARGRFRLFLLVLAVLVLFGARAHPLTLAPLFGIVAGGAAILVVTVLGRVWRLRPQVTPWAGFAVIFATNAYAIGFEPALVSSHLGGEIGGVAVGFFAVCVLAGRVRQAELLARPPGLLSLPQSIVPLLDRSHHHAVIAWFE